jgi:hypothetical protein
MKAINFTNYFFVGFPILLCGLGLLDMSFLFFGLLFTILTGTFQVLTGISIFLKNPRDVWIQMYLLAVILYFSFWHFLNFTIFGISFEYALFAIPIILAIYFTIILHRKKN